MVSNSCILCIIALIYKYTVIDYKITFGGVEMSNILFNNNMSLVTKSLDASWLKNKVISYNLANGDTPGYKRKDVEFESLLKLAMDDSNGKLSQKSIQELEPVITEDNSNTMYRLDGNSVDIDVEMVERVKNEMRYNSLVNQINNQFKMLDVVLKAK